eukprot:scaffold118611_cov50-Prasinocladus_malaysianus.AAC.1
MKYATRHDDMKASCTVWVDGSPLRSGPTPQAHPLRSCRPGSKPAPAWAKQQKALKASLRKKRKKTLPASAVMASTKLNLPKTKVVRLSYALPPHGRGL